MWDRLCNSLLVVSSVVSHSTPKKEDNSETHRLRYFMRLFNGLLWGFAGVPNVAWHLRGPSCQSRTCSWLWEKVSPGGLVQQRDSSGSKLDHWCDLVGFKRLRFHGNWTTLWDFVRFHAPASYVFVATQHAHELATGQIHPEQSPEALVSWSLMARYSDYSDFRILWEDKPPSTSMSMIYNIHIYISQLCSTGGSMCPIFEVGITTEGIFAEKLKGQGRSSAELREMASALLIFGF